MATELPLFKIMVDASLDGTMLIVDVPNDTDIAR